MSRPLFACALLALLATAVPAHAADDFADFRIPDNRVLQWTGTANGSGDWSQSATTGAHRESGSGTLVLASQLGALRDAEAGTTQWSITARLGGQRSHQLWNDAWPAELSQALDESRGRSLAQAIALAWDRRWYTARSPLYLQLQLAGSGNYSQAWTSNLRFRDEPYMGFHDDEVTSSAYWRYSNDVAVTIGAGLGHVRNATGLYEARTLEMRLRATGALTRPLGPEARARLAALMYARQDLVAAHDRPAGMVWSEIGRILAADGALRDSALTAGDAFGLVEPFVGRLAGLDRSLVPSSPVLRQRGWTAGVVFTERSAHSLLCRTTAQTSRTLRADTLWYFADTGGSTRQSVTDDFTEGGVASEFHRPVGMALQFDADFSLLADLRPHAHGFEESAHASAAWIAADRWLVRVLAAHSRTQIWAGAGPARIDSWHATYGVSAEYFVNDHVDLSLALEQVHVQSLGGLYFVSPSGERDRTGSLTFGLTYRFAGFVAIPALAPFPAD